MEILFGIANGQILSIFGRWIKGISQELFCVILQMLIVSGKIMNGDGDSGQKVKCVILQMLIFSCKTMNENIDRKFLV